MEFVHPTPWFCRPLVSKQGLRCWHDCRYEDDLTGEINSWSCDDRATCHVSWSTSDFKQVSSRREKHLTEGEILVCFSGQVCHIKDYLVYLCSWVSCPQAWGRVYLWTTHTQTADIIGASAPPNTNSSVSQTHVTVLLIYQKLCTHTPL